MNLAVAERWYEAEDVGVGVTRLWEPHVNDFVRCNIWLVRGRDRDLLIDSGMGLVPLRTDPRLAGGKPVTAVATHIHFDHVGALHEFDDRRAHGSEAGAYETMPDAATLAPMFRSLDNPVDALPFQGFRAEDYRLAPAPLTGALADGEVIDLGDRRLTVLHLPGHSRDSLGFWEEATGLLFSGDALYEGELLDDLPTSDVEVYRATMQRLGALEIRSAHGGHGPSFGNLRKNELVADYLAGRRRQGCPAR